MFILNKFLKANFYNHAHDRSGGRTSGKQIYNSSYLNVCVKDEILVHPSRCFFMFVYFFKMFTNTCICPLGFN